MPMTTNSSRRPLAVLLLAAMAVLVMGGVALANAPQFDQRPDPAPVGVWNDSDEAATVVLVGAGGNAFFVVPAHALGTVAAPPEIGEVQRLTTVGANCRVPSGGNHFGGGSNPFSFGGQALIRDGVFAGWTARLPAQWATTLDAVPGGCPAAS